MFPFQNIENIFIVLIVIFLIIFLSTAQMAKPYFIMIRIFETIIIFSHQQHIFINLIAMTHTPTKIPIPNFHFILVIPGKTLQQ